MESGRLLAAAAPQVDLAWHLLSVLLRLGRPAAPSDLAATATACAVSPDLVEMLCRIPGSPLRLAGGGVVTASETAVVAFARLVGLGVATPLPPKVRVGEVRRSWGDVVVKYARKRRAPDAWNSGAKRRLLMTPERDLEESKQQQLIVRSCIPVATSEVHLEVIQQLQNRLVTPTRLIVEPSLGFAIRATLNSSISEITIPWSQPKINQSLEGNDGCCVSGNMASIAVPKELLGIRCCIDVPCFDAKLLESICETSDNEISRTAEHEAAPSFYNCIVEDSESPVKEPSHHPAMVEAGLVDKNDTQEVVLLHKEAGTPVNCNTKATDNVERIGAVSNQAEAPQDVTPCAANCENMPTLLVHSAGAVGCKEVSPDVDAPVLIHEAKQSLSESPIGTKIEHAVHEVNHRAVQTLCESLIDTKVEPAELPPNATSYNCNDGEQLCNQVGVNVSKKWLGKKIDKHIRAKQREKGKKIASPKEDKDQIVAKVQKSPAETKPFPNFMPFDIEEEEGSGGYGTVYRARRKTDGKIFAIKCPHANAHSHHVNNELKMLERFGGKNFVIKYECSFKSGDLECFVLEHVEHDRPEILKKEVDVFGLQWYGYCMFRALASLHRQGIVHRDVKPGNFLFSRKLNKGYLIDFNLANDLQTKFLRNCKSETISSVQKNAISQLALKSSPVKHAKETAIDPKQPTVSKRKRSNRSPLDSIPKVDNKSKYGSQAAEISGVTSAKDPTSTKTSVDRLKQPMPYKGRKELMNFLHEAMQSPNQKAATAPASQRKRVAAPFSRVDQKLFILTPMPLRSGGSAVAGLGIFNGKVDGKRRREGPCVGTKGFRAPEVLFRSFHQGCKVDVWSAGVSLLYLMIGKTPFGGDPEQNIKEIAKLRGSEELWEVAKLHNCESSYPPELFDVRSLQSVDLKQWCAANTRRPEFLKTVPDSLFDLVEKCLTVNPRCRITSEEALLHEFFAPCHESLIKQRILRRSAVSNPAACLPKT